MTGAAGPQHMLVAEVLRPHGLRGAVQVRLLADSWGGLGRPTTLYLNWGPAGQAGEARAVTVEWARGEGRRLTLKLAGVDSRAAAAALAGGRLGIPRSAAPRLPEGQYYHYDILGLTVVDAAGQDRGRVVEIVSTPGNDVYVVRGPEGEWLLPAARAFIAAVDTAAGVIRVRDVAGLLEASPAYHGPRPGDGRSGVEEPGTAGHAEAEG